MPTAAFTEDQIEGILGMSRSQLGFTTTTPTTLAGWAYAVLRPALEA